MAGATLKRPVPNSDEVGILPRIHHNWPSEKNSVQSPPQLPEWHFPRSKLRLQTVLGQGNFGQVSVTFYLLPINRSAVKLDVTKLYEDSILMNFF